MPRVSLRRTCVGLIAAFALTVFIFNVHFKDHSQQLVYSPGEQMERSAPSRPPVLEGIVPMTDETTGLVDGTDDGTDMPWFMKNGWVRPRSTSHSRSLALWPDESDSDRIVNQLNFVPPNVDELTGNGTKLKTILLYNGISNWAPLKPGQGVFMKNNCPVSTCSISANREDAANADAILFRDHYIPPSHHRTAKQVWILYMLECPLHTQSFNYRKIFNWTATYRHDSDIVAPYEKFVPYNSEVKYLPVKRNYAYNKTGKVAWFVSNCGARNGRLTYARELAKHIRVDIFGTCGTKSCPRTQAKKCSAMLDSDYKFYLSFENSNCRDYITEKFFVNGLSHDVIPIVLGAQKEAYIRAAPPHSFISVEDFDSPKSLAEYLHQLDTNDTLYNEYFRWKGTGEFINTYFWCRVCALLHDQQAKPKVYDNIDRWWNGPGTCVTGRWKKSGVSWWS